MNASITLSVSSSKLITEAGIAEGAASKRWKMAADALIADGVTPEMLGTVAKPEGLDGKANIDVTRSVVAAITASFSKTEQALLGTDPDAINISGFDIIARYCGMKAEDVAKKEKETLKVLVKAVKGQRTALQVEQASRLNKLRRYLIAEQEAAEAEKAGTPRGPKSDLDRVHERIADAIKYLQRQGEKKESPTFDVAQAVKLLREADKIVPRV